MTTEAHRGLGLLIALSSSGCLGLPRYIEDDGDGDDDDDGPTTSAVDEGPLDEGPVGSDAMSVDGAASFLFQPDVGMGTATTTSVSVGDDTDVTTDAPEPSYACQAYSALVVECYSGSDGEAAYGYCVEYLGYIEQYSPGCVPLFEEYLVCLSVLSCRELAGPEQLCQTEIQKYEECQSDG